ncbi:MAG: S8 family serine peptidase [Methanosarcinales archaeon]|nr:S8 family serine peptidase [Methanosarcinales archaeon]
MAVALSTPPGLLEKADPHSGQMGMDPDLEEMVNRGMDDIPVIMVFRDERRPDVDGLELDHIYRIINGAACHADADTIRRLAADGAVEGIYLDGQVQAAKPVRSEGSSEMVCPARMVSAPQVWEEGLDGSGITVAVIDSGIDKNHPDLAGKVAGEVNFVTEEDTTSDLLGHGTLVAGIVAGSGTASGGKYRGIAPGAQFLNVRVIASDGNGQVSDIIAGIEWALDNDAQILSLSLAGLNLGETNPPVTMAADNAMDAGAVVCVAAGNNG